MIIEFYVYETSKYSLYPIFKETTYTLQGTLKEINDKVNALKNENVYFEPKTLQWKGITANVNDDLAELISIIENMPDFSKV
jgi:hypothetical protein